jgi:hypothetical protein
MKNFVRFSCGTKGRHPRIAQKIPRPKCHGSLQTGKNNILVRLLIPSTQKWRCAETCNKENNSVNAALIAVMDQDYGYFIELQTSFF